MPPHGREGAGRVLRRNHAWMASRRRKRRRSRGISGRRSSCPQLEQRHWDLIGLGLVALRGLLRLRLLPRLGRRRGGRGAGRRHPLPVRRRSATWRRSRCSPPARLIVIRPMLPAVHPFKTGALCLVGGAHARPRGRLARPRARRHARATASSTPTTCASHGGLVGESLFWASRQAVLRGRLAHPVRVPAARRRAAAHRRLDRRACVQATRERGHDDHASACGARRARPATGRHRAAARRPDRRAVEPPEPEDQSRSCAPRTWRRRRSTPRSATPTSTAHEERARARARSRTSLRTSRSRSPQPEPEPEAESERARAGGAHPDGQPPLGGHRGRRLRLPHAQAVAS